MTTFDFDLFVIGAGSGGVRAARIAAGHGAKVAIAEESRFGGTCVIRGCVPKKLMVYAAEYGYGFAEAEGFGWERATPKHDWAALIAAKDRELERLEAIYRNLLTNAGATVFHARATVAGPNAVKVGGATYTAKTILVATGAAPTRPPIPGAEYTISSNEVFHLDAAPKRIVIMGAGYIACEFAGIFNGLGVDVVQLVRGPQILRGFDDDMRAHLSAEMVKSGIDLRLSTEVTAIERRGNGFTVILGTGETLEVDAVMAATGRKANTLGLGLQEAGVDLNEDGSIKVDAWSRTSAPGIYAVGDVTNRINLTPVAISEGHAFADTVFGGRERATAYDNVPSAVFSQPQLASVGLSEEQARASYAKVSVYRSNFKPMRATLSGRDQRVLMKLIVDADTDRVIGAHMVGPEAGEIMQGIAVAIKAKATKADFDATIGIHPTMAEEFVTMRVSS